MNKFITCSQNMSNVYLLFTVYRIPNIGDSSRKSKPNVFNLKLLNYYRNFKLNGWLYVSCVCVFHS